MSLLGALGNICGAYAHGFQDDCRDVIEGIVKMVSVYVGLPVFEVRKVVEELDEYVRGSEMRICGYSREDVLRMFSEIRRDGEYCVRFQPPEHCDFSCFRRNP